MLERFAPGRIHNYQHSSRDQISFAKTLIPIGFELCRDL
jgi:hypothetical protein